MIPHLSKGGPPFKVIGYAPTLDHLLSSIGRPGHQHWNARDAESNVELVKRNLTTTVGASALEWHHDGFGSVPWLFTWCDTYPTEFRWKDTEQIWRPEAGQIIVIPNPRVEHRVPPDFVEAVVNELPVDRSFARCHCLNYEQLTIVLRQLGWR